MICTRVIWGFSSLEVCVSWEEGELKYRNEWLHTISSSTEDLPHWHRFRNHIWTSKLPEVFLLKEGNMGKGMGGGGEEVVPSFWRPCKQRKNCSHTLKSTIKSRLWYKWEIQGSVSTSKTHWAHTKLLLKTLFIINIDYLQHHCKITTGCGDRRVSGSSAWDLETRCHIYISKQCQQTMHFYEGYSNRRKCSKPDCWATLGSDPSQGEENLQFTSR